MKYCGLYVKKMAHKKLMGKKIVFENFVWNVRKLLCSEK